MAVSERKLRANRENAKKSTGPKTQGGKAVVRLNAVKHGILASEAVIKAGEGMEDGQAFRDILNGLREDFNPQSTLEELLLEKAAVILWRWRRILRYELGAIRTQADEAVEAWRKERQGKYQRALQEKELYPNLMAGVSVEPWEHTEDLEFEVKEAEEFVKAVSSDDPLRDPHPRLWFWLGEAAEDRKINVKKALGIKVRWDWYEAELDGDPEAPRKVFKALCDNLGKGPQEVWAWIRDRAAYRLENAQKKLEKRLMAEERVRMLAAIPDSEDLEKIMRYEAHLAREFDRTMNQLKMVLEAKNAG